MSAPSQPPYGTPGQPDPSQPGTSGPTPPTPDLSKAGDRPAYGPPPGHTPPAPAPAGYHYAQPDDPGAQTSLIVGILGLALGLTCGVGFLASPVAIVLGARSKARIDASGGQLGGRSNAQAGFIMGIAGTILLALAILALVAFVAIAVLGLFAASDWVETYGYSTAF